MKVVGICGKSKSGKDALADILVARHGFEKVSLADPMKRFAARVFGFTEHQLWGPSSMRNAPDVRFAEVDAWAAARRNLDDYAPGWLSEIHAGAAHVALNDWFQFLFDDFEFGRLDKALSPRKVLQTLGTEFGRCVRPTLWIEQVDAAVDALLTRDEEYLRITGCTGCRRGSRARAVVVPDVRFANEVATVDDWGGFTVRISRFDEQLPDGASSHKSETEQNEIPKDMFRLSFRNVAGARAMMDFADSIARDVFDE